MVVHDQAAHYPRAVVSSTVVWSADPPDEGSTEGARARHKRLTRRLLTDTATAMFLERGFDEVRVVEVARACGVSEKTVYNYFPTKESLLLDRWETTEEFLRSALADTSTGVVDAAVGVLAAEVAGLTTWLAAQDDVQATADLLRRFRELVDGTPSLRAYQRDATERLVSVVAGTLAARGGAGSSAPEPWIAATALVGLWEVQSRSLRRRLELGRSPDQIRREVMRDVRRAGRVLASGLDSWGT